MKLKTLLLISAFGFYAPIQAQTARFIPGPDPAANWDIGEYGPTGLELRLEPPGFTMKVTGVIAGSPAALSGQISVNQIIESINGVALDEATDPRFTLGDIITDAEASDGVLALQIRDVGQVTVNIPVLGAYSATWPLNCPKSDNIVNNLAELIASQAQPNKGSILFLLSTGNDAYLPVIENWIANMGSLGTYPWHFGMGGLGVCEYYLRTGDSKALPLIQDGANRLRDLMYVGGWSGRGYASITYSTGSGHLNAAGVPALTFLILAKLCGVNVDEYTLQESLRNFYRYAGHDNVGYGNNWPEGGFRDNGKTSALAFAMQAAARLDPAGESSIYARARDISAVKAFYANPWFNRAHPGGGYGEMWHAMAMGFMGDTRPAQYRDYMDARRWHFELSRYHNGGIGISDGGGSHDFDKATGTEWDWGTFYALAYTMPRKELILFGAPLTEHCVPYDLPDLPWGTAADEAFLSLTPATQSGGAVTDLSVERLGTHDSVGYNAKMQAAGVTDDELMEYAHHIDHGIRSDAAKYIVAQGRNHLLLPLLQSSDPRVRHAGLLTITGMFKGSSFALGSISQDAIAAVEGILEDANESLWVRIHAARALARFDDATIGAHKATLLAMLDHDDWWVGDAAGQALREIITANDHYQDIIPPMARFSAEIPVVNLLWGYAYPQSAMMKNLAAAPAPVRDLAAEYFVLEHADNPVIMQAPGGHVVTQGATYINDWLGQGTDKLLGAEPMPRGMALSTVTYRKTLNEADRFDYDGFFTYDPGMATTWQHVAKISTPDSLGAVIDAGPPTGNGSEITLADGGFVEGQAGAVWTAGYYIDLFRREAREALKMRHNGKYYLLIENGTFDAANPVAENWHPGYTAYVRKFEDTDAPAPDPTAFALPPTGMGAMTVGMVAATAIDGSEPVEYYFENTTNADFRDWSTDPAWNNTGLGAGTYGYRVKARDGEGNETAWSVVANASPGGDATAPSPNPMTFERPPTAKTAASITMTASTALDFNGVEYYFACTSGGGPDSGWQDNPVFTPAGLTTGAVYTYVVRARDKSAARNTTADSAPASAAPEAITDTTPPLLALVDPANNATGVAADASLVITFDEEIAAGTGVITIKNLIDGTETPVDIADPQIAISGTTVTITPIGGFIEGRTYAIRIRDGVITDLAGNDFGGIHTDATWQFTIADTNPPVVQSLSPVDETTDVDPTIDLVIAFDEPIAVGIGNVTIKNLTDGTQTQIDIMDGSQVTVSGSTLTITPTSIFEGGKRFAVQVDATAITDLVGNSFAGITDDTTWNFSTEMIGTYTWIQGGVATDWNDPANWLGGVVPLPDEQGATLIFGPNTTGQIGDTGNKVTLGSLRWETNFDLRSFGTWSSQTTTGVFIDTGTTAPAVATGSNGARMLAYYVPWNLDSDLKLTGNGKLQIRAANTNGVNGAGGFIVGSGFTLEFDNTHQSQEYVYTGGVEVLAGGSVDLTPGSSNGALGDGPLSIEETGSVKLVSSKPLDNDTTITVTSVGADPATNTAFFTNSGGVTVSGQFTFDLSAAGTTLNNKWTVFSVVPTFGAAFSVASTTAGTWTEDPAGVWSGSENGATYEFNESTGNLSVVPTDDTTPPNWVGIWPQVSGVGATGATAEAQIDEDGTAWFVVLANDAPAPTSAQVRAGNDAADLPAIASGSIALTATTEGSAAITGLSNGTAYDVYFVAEDDESTPNLQADPVLVEITTQSPYADWSGGLPFDGDANGDGVQDGLAFLLGAATPATDASGLLPTATNNGGALELTFTCLPVADRGGATLNVQHSSDSGLGDAWVSALVPDVSGGPTNGVTFTVNPGSPTNTVTASIGASEASEGRLFGRLEGTE